MPSYGYLKLGCTVLTNPQQTIDYLTCSTEAPRLPFHVQVMSEPCLSARATDASGFSVPFRSPALDDAPWYSATAERSNDFLGMIVSDITGLDSTLRREMTPRAVGIGGGALGPLRAGHREMTVRATMYAASCEGMDYGMRWLTNTLYGGGCGPDDLCDLEVWTGCPDDGTLSQSRWYLKNVSVLSGPTFADGPFDYSPCNIREVEFVLASEEPWLYRCPVSLTDKATAFTAPSTGCWSVCRWIDLRTELAIQFLHSGAQGLDTFDVTFRAGPRRPLNATVRAWVNTHGDPNCNLVDRITLGDQSWFYDVAADGTWVRWDIDSDEAISGTAVAGSGTITGATVAGSASTYRDIKVRLPKEPFAHPLRMENFRDGLLVGGELLGGLVVDGWTGVAHLEGLQVSASAVGISGSSTGSASELHIREVRVTGCSSTAVFVGEMDEVVIDGLAVTECGDRGLWLDPETTDGITQVIVQRFTASAASASGNMVFFRQGGRYHTLLNSVFLQVPEGYSGTDLWDSYCGPEAELFPYEPISGFGGMGVRWPSTSGIRGFLLPFGYDTVPEGSVGWHYVPADVSLGTPCLDLEIVNLPQNHSIKIESSTRRIVGFDPAGRRIDGYGYIKVPSGQGLGWLETDCDPLCFKVEQRRGLEGDGATIEVEQLHREL